MAMPAGRDGDRERPPASAPGRVLRFERSALLHPRAADALALAASPYPPRERRLRRVVGRTQAVITASLSAGSSVIRSACWSRARSRA